MDHSSHSNDNHLLEWNYFNTTLHTVEKRHLLSQRQLYNRLTTINSTSWSKYKQKTICGVLHDIGGHIQTAHWKQVTSLSVLTARFCRRFPLLQVSPVSSVNTAFWSRLSNQKRSQWWRFKTRSYVFYLLHAEIRGNSNVLDWFWLMLCLNFSIVTDGAKWVVFINTEKVHIKWK